MRVYRGRARTIEADRTVIDRLLEDARNGERAVRVWCPHRQIAFGRRDSHEIGYDRARRIARDNGFEPIERQVGGRAVAYDGHTTLAVARAEPITDARSGLDDRYVQFTQDIGHALDDLGIETVGDEPPNSFCAGSHSLSISIHDGDVTRGAPDLAKVAGIAQRVTSGSALVSGVLVVDNRDELAGILAPIYEALDVPFDPRTMGSLTMAGVSQKSVERRESERTAEETGGTPSRSTTRHPRKNIVEHVRSVVESVLVDSEPIEVVRVEETIDSSTDS